MDGQEGRGESKKRGRELEGVGRRKRTLRTLKK